MTPSLENMAKASAYTMIMEMKCGSVVMVCANFLKRRQEISLRPMAKSMGIGESR